MQSQGGLLGSMIQGQPQPQAPQQGGLLGGMAAGQPAPQGGRAGQGAMQMAMNLSQNPSPQMVQQIIQQLHQSGSPEAPQFEQMLSQLGDDPAAIKQFADQVMQKLGGAQ